MKLKIIDDVLYLSADFSSRASFKSKLRKAADIALSCWAILNVFAVPFVVGLVIGVSL